MNISVSAVRISSRFAHENRLAQLRVYSVSSSIRRVVSTHRVFFPTSVNMAQRRLSLQHIRQNRTLVSGLVFTIENLSIARHIKKPMEVNEAGTYQQKLGRRCRMSSPCRVKTKRAKENGEHSKMNGRSISSKYERMCASRQFKVILNTDMRLLTSNIVQLNNSTYLEDEMN